MSIGRGPQVVGQALLIAVLALTTCTAGYLVRQSRCDDAFHERAWNRVVAECHGDRWQARQRLGRAWLALQDDRSNEALAAAAQLAGTDVAGDAAFLAGYIHAKREGDAEPELARQCFQQALTEFQRIGRHDGAARAAAWLSDVARSEMRFDEQLRLSQLAIEEAKQSGDAGEHARALGKLAEAYDGIGMEQAARDSFLAAEQRSQQRPYELANILFKYAAFLLDLGTPHGLQTSLRYLDAAENKRAEAIAKHAGDLRYLVDLALGIRLNRADALCQLDRLDAADRELDAAIRELGQTGRDRSDLLSVQRARIDMVRGYIAARRHDMARAEALFRDVENSALDEDYRIRIALERARMYDHAGARAPAERAYREAITIIEHVRSTAQDVELRPWVLARRTQPYVELLRILVEQDRGPDALAVAESLHARAWLDVVLEQRRSDITAAPHALSAARIRQRLRAAPSPPLAPDTLMATLGDREALVFLTIGPATWRGHIAHGDVHFTRLPDDTLEAAYRFRLHPEDRVVSERAALALLPAELTTSPLPLYIIASGDVAAVPFAALRRHDRFLIEQRPIAYVPGLAALRCTPRSWDARAVILADSRGDLPDAAREAKQLAVASHAIALLGPAASREALALAQRARLLHVAVHGTYTPAGPAITLADGEFTATDVLDTGLAPEVVVLAGCATAASNDAESWNGFPSAFLAAGSHYVIATLRSVEDAAAARVTAAYHEQPEQMRPIARLAAAQRGLLDQLPVEAWASFAAWGDEACDAPVADAPVRSPVRSPVPLSGSGR